MLQTQPQKRPAILKAALVLLYGRIACGLLQIPSIRVPASSTLPPSFDPIILGLTGVLFLGILSGFTLLVHRIGQGKNRARMLYLTIQIVGLLATLSLPPKPDQAFYIALNAIGLLLLFHPRSSAWFKAMKAHNNVSTL